MDRDFVDEVAPHHERTSCSDASSNGNEYFNEFGYPRCVRCCLLHRLTRGQWPHGATFRVTNLRAIHGGSEDDQITERMEDWR